MSYRVRVVLSGREFETAINASDVISIAESYLSQCCDAALNVKTPGHDLVVEITVTEAMPHIGEPEPVSIERRDRSGGGE